MFAFLDNWLERYWILTSDGKRKRSWLRPIDRRRVWDTNKEKKKEVFTGTYTHKEDLSKFIICKYLHTVMPLNKHSVYACMYIVMTSLPSISIVICFLPKILVCICLYFLFLRYCEYYRFAVTCLRKGCTVLVIFARKLQNLSKRWWLLYFYSNTEIVTCFSNKKHKDTKWRPKQIWLIFFTQLTVYYDVICTAFLINLVQMILCFLP